MSEIVQYLIIFALFVVALYVVFKPFFSKKNSPSGCGKGCNCGIEQPSEKKTVS